MQTITQTVAGAQTLQFNINGKYFTILATTLGLNVRFYRGGKKLDLGDIKALLAGLEVSFDANDAFDRIEIDSLGADTFTIGLSNGQSRYNRSQGSVVITNTPNVLITNPISNAVIMVNKGDNYGASSRSLTLLAANTPDTIFTAAANVNGAIIHSIQFYEYNATPSKPAFLAKATAPVSVIDGDAILSVDNFSLGGTAFICSGSLKNPLKIASGKGLFFITDVVQAHFNRSVLYTLL